MTVQNFMKTVRTVFEKFKIFIEGREKKKQKKRHDCMSSRKFFPTPKNWFSVGQTHLLLSRRHQAW